MTNAVGNYQTVSLGSSANRGNARSLVSLEASSLGINVLRGKGSSDGYYRKVKKVSLKSLDPSELAKRGTVHNTGYIAVTNLRPILTLEVQSGEKLCVSGPVGSRQ
jgi:hypothetical protein